MFLSPALGAGLDEVLGLSLSSSMSSSSLPGARLEAVFGSEYFGGETGESSSSPSSTLLLPLTPDLGGGVELSALRPGEDRSSGRIGLSSGNEGLSRPKCLSDKKDRDSEVRTNCSREDKEVGLAPEFDDGNPAFIMLELVVDETEEGLDGSSSLSSLLSWSAMSGLGEFPNPDGRSEGIPGKSG